MTSETDQYITMPICYVCSECSHDCYDIVSEIEDVYYELLERLSDILTDNNDFGFDWDIDYDYIGSGIGFIRLNFYWGM